MSLDHFKKDFINKIDYDKFEAYVNETRNALEEVQKELLMKSNVKETINLLKNKAGTLP